MAKKFKVYVAVHKDPAEVVWFAPGDDAPEWVDGLVGDHCFEVNTDDEEDPRFRDPENEPDDPATKFSVTTVLPESAPAVEDVDDDEVDLDTLTKAELIELAEERGLDTSGTKADLKQRILDDEDDEADEE
jgi:hypothetical protein